jgi:general secretion pathway protein G
MVNRATLVTDDPRAPVGGRGRARGVTRRRTTRRGTGAGIVGHGDARGFTLIELVVVMAMIALLLTLAVPRYFSGLDNGRRAVQAQNIATMRDAIDKFYGDNGKYPDTLEDLVTRRYLRAMPVDPVTELPDWVVIAPADPTLGAIYDVRSSVDPAQATSRGAATPALPVLADPSQRAAASGAPGGSAADVDLSPKGGSVNLSGKLPMFPTSNVPSGTRP